MKKKSSLGIIFCIMCFLLIGHSSIYAANNKTKENIIQPNKIQLDRDNMDSGQSFSKDNEKPSFESIVDEITKLPIVNENLMDVEQAVKDIKAGIVKPLSKDHLPEGISLDYAMNFKDTKGLESKVELGSLKTKKDCDHEYTQGIFSAKIINEDGSCNTSSYDALNCYKCNSIWIFDIIVTDTYRVCPHEKTSI